MWVFALDIPKATIQAGSAYQIWTNASDLTRQYFDLIENKLETIPKAGDLVVWSNKYGKYGHVAIIVEATQTRMKVFEQNNPLGTNAHVQDRAYTNVLGFLRPKSGKIDGVPQWLSTLLQERGLTIENESKIRVIFDKAKRYNDEVKTLQEQVKTANEQLADKALEVSELIGKNELLTAKVEELEVLYNDAKKERDTFSWEKEKLTTKVETLEEEMEKLMIENLNLEEKLNAKKPLDKYTSWELFKTIIGRIKK